MESLRDYIPNFDTLYNKVCEFVKENQGEKGYIDTQDNTLDTIWGFEYDEFMNCAVEVRVHGIKCDPETNELLIVTEKASNTYRIIYTETDFKEAEWQSMKGSYVYYANTLLSIAECIEEYVD